MVSYQGYVVYTFHVGKLYTGVLSTFVQVLYVVMLYCTIYAIEYLSLLQSLLLIKLLGQFTFGMVQYVIVIYNLQSAVTWNYLGLFSCMLVNY